eukprot:TRINITY_DN15937_c0_g1_i4.p1 TRINITY_DN15937_c0_g1~~TRINITY_DN15937_c0_g1_i4.p1  ORF type:complete len:438 (-),score=86.65 TRINITY_DN15937_c0_g1_i4:416-1729(-)
MEFCDARLHSASEKSPMPPYATNVVAGASWLSDSLGQGSPPGLQKASEDSSVCMVTPRSSQRRTREQTAMDNAAEMAVAAETAQTGRAAGTASAAGMAQTEQVAETAMLPGCTAAVMAGDRMPELFPGDRKLWPEWSFVMRAYFVAHGIVTPEELHAVEAWPHVSRTSDLDQDLRKRGSTMYYILVLLVRAKAQRLLQEVDAGNGSEAWRVLSMAMSSLDEQQSVGLMNQILGFEFTSMHSFESELGDFDRLAESYRRQYGNAAVPDQMLRAVVIKGASEPLRGHLQLLRCSSYGELKAAIINYLHAQELWDKSVSGNGTSGAQLHADPVEVISKGKSKGRGKGRGKLQRKWRRSLQYEADDYDEEENDDSEITCFNCGGLGHPASICPSRRRQRLKTGAPAHLPCLRCGRRGHRASDCQEVEALTEDTLCQEGGGP